MQNPTSLILTSIAITDIFIVLAYMFYTIYCYVLRDPICPARQQEFATYFIASLVRFEVDFTIILSFISVWLHVHLALWRFKIMRSESLLIKNCRSFDLNN